MMHKYEIILYWSNEDQVFVAEVPCPDAWRMATIRKPPCETSTMRYSSGSTEPRSWGDLSLNPGAND